MKVKYNAINLYLFYKFTNYRDTTERETYVYIRKENNLKLKI